MWVLTENGELINLDRFYAVEVRSSERRLTPATHQVVARSEREFSVVLCSCDNEEHGAKIVQDIADSLESGVKLYDIRNPLRSAQTNRSGI